MFRPRLKTTTGCYKCKARRKKCDERHPKCTACLRWNFECLWPSTSRPDKDVTIPEVIAAGSQKQAISKALQAYGATRPLSSSPEFAMFRYGPSWSKEERQAFDFFCSQTSTSLSGVFRIDREMNVWSYMLLQGAHQNDNVKHAICALGALHQHLWDKSNKHKGQIYRFAVEQYNKAVRSTLNSTRLRHMSVDAVLIMCVLFTLLERLFGDIKNALSHVQVGLKLLADSSPPGTASQQRAGLADEDIYIPRATINSLLRRLERHTYEIGQTHQEHSSSQGLLSSINIPAIFLSLEDAVESFETYFNRAYRLMATCVWKEDEQYQAQKPVEPDLIFLLRRMLVRWETAFMAYLQTTRLGHARSRSDELMIHTLHSSRLLLSFSLAHYQTGDEMICDEFTSTFADAVAHCAAVVCAQRSRVDLSYMLPIPKSDEDAGSESFHSCSPISTQHDPPGISRPVEFDTPGKAVLTFSAFSPIPTLFTIAWRCRDPTIRRHALQLLRDIDWYDAFWDSKISHKIAERLMQIEENGYLANEEYLGSSRPVAKAEQVLPAARCRQIRIRFEKSHIYVVEFLSINANDWVPEPDKWNGPDSDSFWKEGRIREKWTTVS